MRRVGISKKLSHNGRLGDDLAVVGERGHETTRVDLEVLWLARLGKIDDFLLEGDAQLSEGDVRTVSPCVTGVNDADERLGVYIGR